MNVRKSFVIISCLVGLLLWPLLPAQAQWWQDKSLQEKFKISETQIKEMEAVYAAFLAKRKELANQSRVMQQGLTNLMEQEKLENESLGKSIKELETVRNKLFKETVDARLAIRKILEAEQIKKIIAENPKLLSSEGQRPLRPVPRIAPRPGAGLIPQKMEPKKN